MKRIGHMMILASAGSGKTYALTNRFVKLLAAGAEPERIVALTFTRKAAGEFFDEILNKLARAATDGEEARKLAKNIDDPQLGCADFLRMLRKVSEAMHRLNLGTLDSFFARIVRSFPMELGLGGDFAILDPHAARQSRRRVQQSMFLNVVATDAARQEFTEAFKRATFGAEEKRLGGRLDEFLDAYQEIYLAAPLATQWGKPDKIWPAGCQWLAAAQQRDAAIESLRVALPWNDLNEKQRKRWEDFLSGMTAWSPGADFTKEATYLLKNALEAWPALAEVVVERKKMTLSTAVRDALRSLLMAVIGGELSRRLEMTRGIYAVLRGYETIYHEQVRRAGQLTFADVQRLLAPETGARLLSGRAEDGRLFLDFRLDARYDHWLLDEFQDTSFGQWSVLKNLIDEVVQDTDRGRSFFYVGDVKQAIFAWREGDPRLFREIFDHYNGAAPGTISEDHLVKSYRSGEAIVAAVNQVFGDAATMREYFPDAAVNAWSKEWRKHESAKPELTGQVGLLHADDEPARFARTLEVLQEIRPVERGLTCAILTQKNDTAARLADYLRREGALPALAEADLSVATDNPLTAALLALMQAAAHPGDTLAWEQVQMTPLHGALLAEGWESHDAVSQRLLEQVHIEGFERTIEFWLRRLEASGVLNDDFSRERGAQFAAAARLFDETGQRDVAEFVRFMDAFTEREAETARVIRVMTIHKSKGLGFDVVLLPDLEGKLLDQRRKGLAVQKAADRSVEWVLDLPNKLFFEVDEVLAAHVRQEEADACYEKFSLLYVAMTRAKRAMYLITKPVGSSASHNFPRWLASSLGAETKEVKIGKLTLPGGWSIGAPDWHVGLDAATSPRSEPAGLPCVEIGAVSPRSRRISRRPSEEKTGRWPAAQLFAADAGRATDFGREVHRLFAGIEWWKAASPNVWKDEKLLEGADSNAVGEVLGCLREPDIVALLARPEGRVEVWREKAFEVILGGAWVTGVFDRVIVTRNPNGRTESVTVIDFKTDRILSATDLERAAARHAAQMNVYRQAAALLAGTSIETVRGRIIFTAQCKVVDVSGPI